MERVGYNLRELSDLVDDGPVLPYRWRCSSDLFLLPNLRQQLRWDHCQGWGGECRGTGVWLDSDANSGKCVGQTLQPSCSILHKKGDGEGVGVSELWATIIQQNPTPAIEEHTCIQWHKPTSALSRNEGQGMQKLQEPHALLMRMSMGRWFSEDCLEVSTRAEYVHILWPSNFVHRYVPKQLSAYTHQRKYKNAQSRQKWKITWMSLNSKCINKLRYIHIMQSHAVINK